MGRGFEARHGESVTLKVLPKRNLKSIIHGCEGKRALEENVSALSVYRHGSKVVYRCDIKLVGAADTNLGI